jgi:hypothetical protein
VKKPPKQAPQQFQGIAVGFPCALTVALPCNMRHGDVIALSRHRGGEAQQTFLTDFSAVPTPMRGALLLLSWDL